MLKIKEYVKAESLEQAYEWNRSRSSVILGGMLWLRLQDRRVSTAIDLSELGLDTIEETQEEFRIGAMVTLRQLEQHEGLAEMTQGALKESLRPIVGVQFRNCATVGGSIFVRFGFSDVLTAFMAMDTQVELYQEGQMTLEEFADRSHTGDILVRLIVKKRPIRMKYLSQRNAKTDFPVLTCAVSGSDGMVKCVIGARPHRAVCYRDETGILSQGITTESALEFASWIQGQLVTGSNLRAKGAYRRKIAGVLVKRALLELEALQP